MLVRRFMIALMALLAITPSLHAQTSPQADSETARYVPETHNWISAPLLSFWKEHGAIPTFGYPLEAMATTHTDDQQFTHQVFERYRLEYHPQNQAPYTIQLGRLGEEVLLQQGRNWRDFPQGQPTKGCDFFPQTNHSLCGEFKAYWHAHGLNTDDKPAISYEESLILFGFPLSEPMLETNANGDTVLTQWFERARFEYHPDNPAEHRVLLGLLGKERYGSGSSGVISQLSGSIGMVFLDGDGMIDETNSGPFWEVASRWGLTITKAEIILVGPNYTQPALSSFAGWYDGSSPIEPDNTYRFSASTHLLPPAGDFRLYYYIEGTCPNGKPTWTNPYGFEELTLTAGGIHTADLPTINVRCED